MKAYHLNNTLTSFIMNPLVETGSFLASKQVYNFVRYLKKPGRGAGSSLAGLLLFLYLLLCPMAAWGQEIWDGTTKDDSWYDASKDVFTISTAAQLAGLAQLVNDGNDFSGKTIKLDADIELNDTDGWENWGDTNKPANSWTPIGFPDLNAYVLYFFSGTFDGQGHTIRGIYINTSSQYQGLFGVVRESGRIQNLTVAESYICGGNSYVGGVVGANAGQVSNCSNSGTVTGDVSVGGGIVGGNYGTMSNCSNSGTVTGDLSVGGGIVGWNYYGTMSNCSNSGTVRGDVSVGGGIVGWNNYGTVSNCYYLQGTCENGIGQDDNNQSANVKVKSEAEYKSGEVLLLLDITREIWGQDFDKGYPVPLGSLSAEEQATAKVYSATFTYTLPDAQEATIEIKYGNSGTSLTAPEVEAVDGYTFTWDPEIPETFGTEDIVINGLFKKMPTASDFVFTAPDPDWTYNKSAFDLSNLVKVAEGVTEMGTFTISSWQGTNEVDPINAGTYTVKVSVVGDGSYAAATDLTSDDWTFEIEKADPDYTKPENLSATYGQTLADVELPDDWSWEDETLSVGEVGDNTFTAIFTPDDTENYNVVENIDLTVTVGKANPTPAETPSSYTATVGDRLSSIQLPDGWAWEDDPSTILDVEGSHSFEAIFTPEDTDNYNTVEEMVTITVVWPEPEPEPEPEPIYYRVDLRPVEGATVILSADEVEEGGTLTFTIEIAEGYVADDLLVTVSQGIGKAVEVKPDETGVYTVENVDGLVTITVYGVTEAPTTGIAGVQGVQVYAQEGAILVHTPTEARVVVVAMNGIVKASGKQTGLRRYALPRGFYVVWVDGVSFKVAN